MRTKCRFLMFAAGLLALPAILGAQDSQEAPVGFGGFTTQGSVSVGGRFTDVKGYEPMYLELFDLQPGVRLMDFNAFGEAKEGTNPFADSYSMSMSNLGGDPFPTVQFSVIKNNLYDLRVNWRQAYYYWNQNDDVILPIAPVAKLSTGLTNNHDWATVRKFGSVDFTLHATNHLRFHFNYYRTSDSGSTFTTASPDFLDSPGYWGGYARANPYPLYAPINDETNRFTGGMDYTFHSWTFHYSLGYQTFNAITNATNQTSPLVSINPAASSATEPLTSFTWSQYRRLTTPISELSVVGKPTSKLELRGNYLYYRYTGPLSFDQSFNGIAPDADGVLTPYAVSQSVRGTVKEPDHIGGMGFTYNFKDWWSFNADYRYSRMSSEGIGNFSSLFNGTTPATNMDDIVWKNGVSDFDFTMDLTPIGTLVIRPGIHLMKADVLTSEFGVTDPALTLRTKTAWPEISVGYEPSKKFSIRGDLHSFCNGASYTAITPHTQVGGRVVAQWHITPKLSFDNELNLTNSKLIDTNYRSNFHANASTLSYALNDRFSLFGAFSYESFYAQGDIVYIRGTPPLNDFLQDQEINRVWQGGLDVKPTRHFGLRFSGNYVRSTGLGYVSGEPPAYRPLYWPLATGTVFYDIPKAGRISLDLQRTYYIEQIVTANNFQADLLTIRWTRDF
ncbi:MAG TPA: hypothetical protein VMT20_05195 [Terriglobia bacterium]|nr:hypothetical protein [Terriglobia bacterium]